MAEARFDRDVRLAWHIEVLQRQERLAPLKDLLARVSEDDRRRTGFENFRAAHGLTSQRVRLVRRDVVH